MSIIPSNSFIPGIIKGLGHVGSYFASRMEVNRQNRYNSPKEQARRLREAGLPMAAAESFDNTQTSLPDVSGIGKGTDRFGGYYEVAKTLKEVSILDNQILYWAHQAGLAGLDLNMSQSEKDWLLDKGILGEDGKLINNFSMLKENELKISDALAKLKYHEAEIKGLEENVKRYTTDEEEKIIEKKLESLILNITSGWQDFDNTHNFTEAKNKIIDMIKEGGMNGFEALMLMVLQGFTASISKGGVQIGN